VLLESVSDIFVFAVSLAVPTFPSWIHSSCFRGAGHEMPTDAVDACRNAIALSFQLLCCFALAVCSRSGIVS